MIAVTAQEAQRRRGSWPAPRELLKAGLILALFTLATRLWTFGNPLINVDEQFYVLTGDRLLHGVLPYVDIWDRKPIGLFLIYAFVCRLFANPVIGYRGCFRHVRQPALFGLELEALARVREWTPNVHLLLPVHLCCALPPGKRVRRLRSSENALPASSPGHAE